MHTHHYTFLTLCFLHAAIVNVFGGPWASPAQEHLDELHDAEIYKAVVDSMNAWASRHRHRTKRDEPSVCYPDLGCFEASGPFGYLDMLPSKPEEIATRFLLYPSHSKRRSGNTPGEFPFANISDAFHWAQSGLNNTLPLKVMIHGFGSDCSHIWVYEMRSALMAVDDLNVICVDWGNGATLPNYVKAAANTRLVGKQLAMLLRGMIDKVGFSLRNIHLIGFSLGAHVAGFAGAEFGNLSRITGLDPAGPLFESQDPRARLDQTDAAFVDVIHSNGENLILGGLGSWQPMGHVDFYPNGGRMQKGCSNIFVGAVSDIIWSSAVEGRSLCNHRRAYKFFTDSVSPRCHFPAFPCESHDDFLAGNCFPCSEGRRCGNMGYYADRSKGRGQLYLITRDEEPFCAHQYHIKIESTPSDIPIVSYGKIQITLIGDSLLNETFTLTRKEDEEMRLGSSVSRIIVPHPILLEPTKIQILYSAYSGWLTSGLLQWRIDKITLSDSFGRSSSVCRKNLILDSGVPVVLPLYPGECNLPNSTNAAEAATDDIADSETRIADYEKTKNSSRFLPAPASSASTASDSGDIFDKKESQNAPALAGGLSFRDAFEIFNIPWNNDSNNIVDSETEQSRAFNSRIATVTSSRANATGDGNDTSAGGRSHGGEVVEPILKPSNKLGRSHHTSAEITEPILGPTTAKQPRLTTTPPTTIRIRSGSARGRGQKHNRELVYTFYDVEDAKSQQHSNDWVPTIPRLSHQDNKWKRQDDSLPLPSATATSRVYNYNGEREEQDAFNAIVRTVQFLPQRLARMFEEAEKYARETILPFVSTYTPKFISDFIVPGNHIIRDTTPKYLPLHFEDASTEEIALTTAQLYKTQKLDETITANGTTQHQEMTRNFNPPPNVPNGDTLTTSSSTSSAGIAITTMHTYIQKIGRKSDGNDKLETTTGASDTVVWELEELDEKENSQGRNAMSKLDSTSTTTTSKSVTPMAIPISDPVSSTSTTPTSLAAEPLPTSGDAREVYINLPVIDEKYKEVKYIPLSQQQQTTL